MLIDATHLEEKRVVVVDGVRLDELDIETSTKKQIKGNIYLAKIARVEPSLQAAFVDYGGNRHGFLAFSEIHPDYYQIPVADREALKASMAGEDRDDDEDAPEQPAPQKRPRRRRRRNAENGENAENNENAENTVMADAAPAEDSVQESPESNENAESGDNNENGENGDDAEMQIESVTETEADYMRPSRPKIRNYKIQEVIHRGQVLLVQVTKEERGNKGAALTTYLSLAGRYCVLMPNSAGRGGVSRKITNVSDRKKLKAVIAELDMPAGMSVIVRTAGKERTKLEIKRDYDYLIKTWIAIRDKTMESSAPALIHEECDIIKRALRDMYTRDISEIYVEGEEEYRTAREFMKMLTPSHAKKIHLYKDETIPLFYRYQVESQLEAIHSNIVQLKSGAWLVMDQTEALVAIDVNSGRSTKERSIEETALKVNLEAADEIARQLRLRDMAGLVVIDFIDMEEPRNNHAVERRMKEALKRDRARIQMGRITGFGLMELSRQRLHSSFIESSYSVCPHCRGKGMMRSVESASIHTIRLLEEEALKRRFSEIRLTVPTTVALYVLNNMRPDLTRLEKQYDVSLTVQGDDSLPYPIDYRIERVVREGVIETAPAAAPAETPEQEARAEENADKPEQENGEGRRSKRRRSRRKNKAEQREETAPSSYDDMPDVIQADDMFEEGLRANDNTDAQTDEPAGEDGGAGNGDENGEDENRRHHGRRRQRRRWNKKHGDARAENGEQQSGGEESAEPEMTSEQPREEAEQQGEQERAEGKNGRRRYPRRRRNENRAAEQQGEQPHEDNAERREEHREEHRDEHHDEQPQEQAAPKTKKKGWWQRFAGE